MKCALVNVQNSREYVAGIPRDFEVEVPARVSARGVEPRDTRPLPRAVLAHLLRDRIATIELELEAYLRGSRALLTHLVLTDKWIQSEEHANRLIEEIFALPYHEELREHYR